jgi:hypothetical protein
MQMKACGEAWLPPGRRTVVFERFEHDVPAAVNLLKLVFLHDLTPLGVRTIY